MENSQEYGQIRTNVATGFPVAHYSHGPPGVSHAGGAEPVFYEYKQDFQQFPPNVTPQYQYTSSGYVNPAAPPYSPQMDIQYYHQYNNFGAPQDPSILFYSHPSTHNQPAHTLHQPFYSHYPQPGVYPYGNPYSFYTPPIPRPGPNLKIQHAIPPSAVPPLEYRRNSCSSVASGETPQTPVGSNYVDTRPSIAGEYHRAQSHHPSTNSAPIDYTQSNYKVNFHSPPYVRGNLRPGRRFPSGTFSKNAKEVSSARVQNPLNVNNVYIRGLASDMDDEKLYQITSKFGRLVSYKAIMDLESGSCKGFGFARFETPEEAAKCLCGLELLNYEVGYAKESFNSRLKSLGDPSSTNVYVSNLPRSMSEKELAEVFQDYKVVSIKILRDMSGHSRGVGFASFEDHSVCDRVIKELHGKIIGQEKLALHVRYADTNAQKRFKAVTVRTRESQSSKPASNSGGFPARNVQNINGQAGWNTSLSNLTEGTQEHEVKVSQQDWSISVSLTSESSDDGSQATILRIPTQDQTILST